MRGHPPPAWLAWPPDPPQSQAAQQFVSWSWISCGLILARRAIAALEWRHQGVIVMVNRRIFLLGSAAAAASAQTAPQQTVGTGMIGVGNRGSYLLQAAMAQPNARILALCDIK